MRAIGLLLAVLIIFCGTGVPAQARDIGPSQCSNGSVAGTLMGVTANCEVVGSDDTESGNGGSTIEYVPVCTGGAADCGPQATCEVVGSPEVGYVSEVIVDGVSQGQQCFIPDDPQVTPGAVLAAFRRLSWPASELTIQPPRGRTAVNFDTYFFTGDTEPVTRTVTLLGQRVSIEATPSAFTWRYGDGTVVTTSSPGAAYPEGDVVHRYLREGRVSTRLDTTYSGRYRVGGGPWLPLGDTHTVSGATEPLEVIEVRPTLVSAD